MSVIDSKKDFQQSTEEPGFSLRLIDAERQTKASKLRSIFTFNPPKKLVLSFKEDQHGVDQCLSRFSINEKSKHGVQIKRKDSSKNSKSSRVANNHAKQQSYITFRNFDNICNEPDIESSDTEDIIEACLKKYAKNSRFKRSEFQASDLSNELESINITNYRDYQLSISDDAYVDDISLEKRSIALFNKEYESLETFSEGESSKLSSPLKTKKDGKFRFVLV